MTILDLDTGDHREVEGLNWDVPSEVKEQTGVTHYSAFYQTQQGVQNAGIFWFHLRKDDPSRECVGSASFKGRDPNGKWDLISENPLTIGGSLLCQECGRHGHIQSGRWVEC